MTRKGKSKRGRIVKRFTLRAGQEPLRWVIRRMQANYRLEGGSLQTPITRKRLSTLVRKAESLTAQYERSHRAPWPRPVPTAEAGPIRLHPRDAAAMAETGQPTPFRAQRQRVREWIAAQGLE
jgi:hypothetical protein